VQKRDIVGMSLKKRNSKLFRASMDGFHGFSIRTVISLARAIGIMLNGFMHIPYLLTLAYGWTTFSKNLMMT
jgi:hypothetical protein